MEIEREREKKKEMKICMPGHQLCHHLSVDLKRRFATSANQNVYIFTHK